MRLKESFESKEEAKERAKIERENVESGKRKEKNHGNINNYKWQWKECLEYFRNLEYGSFVNYASTADRFGLKDKKGNKLENGGQLLKGFLKKNGINIEKFKSIRANMKMGDRRAKKR